MIEGVVSCLKRNFPRRDRLYWEDALSRLSHLPPVEDHPRLGFALQVGARVVGVLLTIHSRRNTGGADAVICNLSSWCVDQEYRSSALVLHFAATSRRDVVYTNVSPASHTIAMIEALGFRPFVEGQTVCAPVLARRRKGVSVVGLDHPESAILPEDERKLLTDHAGFGCISFVCIQDGAAYPFVFRRRRVLRAIACAQLVYCRELNHFTRFAFAIGKRLMFQCGPFCLLDAPRPQGFFPKRYFPGRNPKYFKGGTAPRIGDLSYSELAIFGA